MLKKFVLPSHGTIQVVEHALIVGAAALFTFISENIGLSFGPWSPFIVAALSILGKYLVELIGSLDINININTNGSDPTKKK